MFSAWQHTVRLNMLFIYTKRKSLQRTATNTRIAVSHGLGRHVWAAKRDCLYAWALGLFVAEICYTLTLVFVELSILSFFWRSFSVRDSIQWPILILASLVCIWGAAVVRVD